MTTPGTTKKAPHLHVVDQATNAPPPVDPQRISDLLTRIGEKITLLQLLINIWEEILGHDDTIAELKEASPAAIAKALEIKRQQLRGHA